MMKLKDLKEKSAAELTKLLSDKRVELRSLRFRVAMDEHKDVREIREARTLIAQILTVLQERQSNGR